LLAQKTHLETDKTAIKYPQLNQAKKVLIIEDEALFARAVMMRLQKAGFECENAETKQDGRVIAKQFSPDLVLLDMRLPDGNGLDLLPEFVANGVTVIVMTAHGDVSDAVNAIKLGAIDYLKKPIDLEELLLIVQKNEKTVDLKTSLDYSRQRNTHNTEGVSLIGESVAIQSLRLQIARIAQLGAMSDATPPTVLISGETGTGKDVAARLLHASYANSDKPFVHVDCASLPAELIESELFGHDKGAFTGAVGARPGLIEAAEDGTLFLDEIGELPLTLQAKLLNVLERRVVRRLGSTKERSVPARIIAATNRDLHEMSKVGKFRSDLYYRLNVMMISLAPLRERGEDVLLLANYFTHLTEKRYGLAKHTLSATAVEALLNYTWPGNVRELRHQISRAVLLSNNAQITATDLALPTVKPELQVTSQQAQLTLDAAEKHMLLNALEASHNNVSEAARKLGITRMTMRYRMDKHGLNT
jgi:two-component system, NtrC family, response regulator AtoC